MDSIHGDLSLRVVVDTSQMEWAPSPSGSVWRKRVHRVGPPESGQVTSVVRYEPNSRFPAHDHPEGEEILVLDGVFSDEHGDWPQGTYLLNPEGFRHEPFSREGCRLFVKLRQFAGLDRRHVVIDTHAARWGATARAGVSQMPLYEQKGFSDCMALERWGVDAEVGTRSYAEGAELFVLDGAFEDDEGAYPSGCWLRLPREYTHRPRTSVGCVLYVKTAGLADLRSAAT